jgi:hypothetical protein
MPTSEKTNCRGVVSDGNQGKWCKRWAKRRCAQGAVFAYPFTRRRYENIVAVSGGD